MLWWMRPRCLLEKYPSRSTAQTCHDSKFSHATPSAHGWWQHSFDRFLRFAQRSIPCCTRSHAARSYSSEANRFSLSGRVRRAVSIRRSRSARMASMHPSRSRTLESMKRDGALQFGRLERTLFDGTHEDSRAATIEQLNAELAAPSGQALRWCDLRQIRIYLQGGHGCDSSRFLLIARRILNAPRRRGPNPVADHESPSGGSASCPPKTGCQPIGLRHTLASQGCWSRGKPVGR
jgi:hypothetical protein